MVPDIISGFDLDCNTLFIRFEKLSTVRYTAFAEIWRDMKFSLVFNGRRVKELVCFTTEALSYLKYYVMQTESFLRRICALYIMYGIYYKQPIQHTSKILLTLEEWINVKEFIDELKENEHFDALIILLKLVFDNAFEFSVTNSVCFTPISDKGMIHTNYSDLICLENLDMSHLTDKLENIEAKYREAKQKLSANLNIPYVNYSNDNFSQELKDILELKTTNITEESKPGTSKQIIDDPAEKRRLIREKGFKKKVVSSLHRSVVLDKMNSDTDE